MIIKIRDGLAPPRIGALYRSLTDAGIKAKKKVSENMRPNIRSIVEGNKEPFQVGNVRCSHLAWE
jgi:hypothetical protein